ncbi:hypothetical protein HMPREF9445_01051 [Bacteroides clarus YIT 12056]|uniref:Uncharacterized protein n=1 Tax=Bacteroides clarus YIT 12056 TaxID=762984 RepID=A0ABN0CQD5_9BACE|nr:hypothetical protein HMPREF9445_01051 [Bacteroides clarus YIT 12056]
MIFSKSRKTHLLTTPGEDRDKDKHFSGCPYEMGRYCLGSFLGSLPY